MIILRESREYHNGILEEPCAYKDVDIPFADEERAKKYIDLMKYRVCRCENHIFYFAKDYEIINKL